LRPPLSSALSRRLNVNLVEFEIDPAEAANRFQQYQAASCKGLHAKDLLHPEKAMVSAAYLPFWGFSCNVTAEYKGKLAFKDSR
jgi:hypothetical protein